MSPSLEPLNQTVIDEAVTWLSHFWSGDADETSYAEWQRWRAADPSHERAWQQIEAMDSRWNQGMQNLTANSALQALSAPRGNRRQVLKALSLMTVAVGAGWAAQRQMPWPAWVADARTATGKSQAMTLADGSKITLNTDSAINLTFNELARGVELIQGEIFVATATDRATPQRPFVVHSASGSLSSLDAEFLLHQRKEDVLVSVLKGSALVHPKHFAGAPLQLDEGQSVIFSENRIAATQSLSNQAAWLDGVLIASNTPLAEFIADLSRYYPGSISCDPTIAGLRFSGTFPLSQIQRIPVALMQVIPIQVQTFGPWFTRLTPRENASSKENASA
ncbi:MAG: FecR family protein [Cellvibrio sp.]|uniref:FecR domain-containing protein n=1 Tax=Cellvibrio sp. TaxID=1965322 RepID=UPI0031ADDA57